MRIKDNPIIYLTSMTWKYSKGNRKNVVLYIILFTFSNIFSMSEPLIIAKVLNIVQETGVNKENFLTFAMWLSLFVISFFVFWMFHYPGRIIERKNAFLVRANYKKFMLHGIMNLPLQWHTDHHSGDTIDKIEKGSQSMFRYSQELFTVIETVLTFVIAFIALAYFNLHSIYLLILLLILIITIVIKFDNKLRVYYKKLNRSENRIASKVYDSISNITTIVILRIEKLVEKSIWKKIMWPFGLFQRKNKIDETKWFLGGLVIQIFTFLIIISYVYFGVQAGEVILVGSLYALYGYISRVSERLYRFSSQYGEMVWMQSAVRNAEELSIKFKEKLSVEQIKLNGNWEKMQIKDLNFSYNIKKGQKLHLKNINIDIKRGQRIAFIGESGSGKTTMLKVMRELYKPKKLDLFVDETKLNKGFAQISSNIALIPQDPELFNTTIKENITMGVSYSEKLIKKFTDMARFSSVVLRLPKKMKSSVEEKGVNLSGGEKQRLALARGLLASKDRAILLLDEPTSSVDFRNEMKIYESIFNEFPDKTIISSIHRLHMLPMFDMIYFFEDGRIIASGNFDVLLRKSPKFKNIWEKQKKFK